MLKSAWRTWITVKCLPQKNEEYSYVNSLVRWHVLIIPWVGEVESGAYLGLVGKPAWPN